MPPTEAHESPGEVRKLQEIGGMSTVVGEGRLEQHARFPQHTARPGEGGASGGIPSRDGSATRVLICY